MNMKDLTKKDILCFLHHTMEELFTVVTMKNVNNTEMDYLIYKNKIFKKHEKYNN